LANVTHEDQDKDRHPAAVGGWNAAY